MRSTAWLLVLFLLGSSPSVAQHSTPVDTSATELEEVVVAFNRWEHTLNEVPNRIEKVDMRLTRLRNPQTTADLLAQTGAVFVQKSQLGGGSPMIRGFATNRVLIVADGIRMNNAIYRSGNIQNIISIDPFTLAEAEVIFGPGANIYGSDAIGGVMDFHSLKPALARDSGRLFKAHTALRYATANQERTAHADLNLGGRKWSFLSSFTHSDFGDLRMGRRGGEEDYLRQDYVVRIHDRDSILKNPNPLIQRFTGYRQLNFLQKIRFRPTPYLDFHYGFTYAETGNTPRYDRLLQRRQGSLRFAEWAYGPMIWRLHNLQFIHSRKNVLYDRARLILAGQGYAESRIERTRNSLLRNRQQEGVAALHVNWDAQKQIGKGDLFFGLEYVWNKVSSEGSVTDIRSGMQTPVQSRYPDGSRWTSSGVYGSYKHNLTEKITLSSGLRGTYGNVYAKFDDRFVSYPFDKVTLRSGALTGNAGIVYRPTNPWQLNLNFSTGFRMPNVDDLGKTFESTPGRLTVPNPALRPEYAWNAETGLVWKKAGRARVEVNLFHTRLNHAIVRRPSTFNGSDSIDFNGEQLAVEALQNAAYATVYGIQLSSEIRLFKALLFRTTANLIQGRETDDNRSVQVPLRHAPPFYGNSLLRLTAGPFILELDCRYNSRISPANLAPTEQAKPEIYARDGQGRPYSPGWYTLGLSGSWQLRRGLLLTTGWENMTDQRYRPYASGIVSAGSNLILSLRAGL